MGNLVEVPVKVTALRLAKAVDYVWYDPAVVHRRAFKDYLEGKSGLVVTTPQQFYELFYNTKHYPVCFFNMNYSDAFPLYTDSNFDNFYPGIDTEIAAVRFMQIANYSFLPFPLEWSRNKETGKYEFSSPILIWLDPLSSAVKGEVDKSWTVAVSRLLGDMILPFARIARMLPLDVSVPGCTTPAYEDHHNMDSHVIFAPFDMPALIYHGQELKTPPMTHKDIDECDYFIAYDYKPEFIGTSPIARMIEAHRNYSLLMNNLRAEWLNWVESYADEVVEMAGSPTKTYHSWRDGIKVSNDPSFHAKLSTIMLWLTRNNSDNYVIELFTDSAYNHLREITELFAILTSTPQPAGTNHARYVFIDNDGGLQTVQTNRIVGFTEIPKCDDAVEVLYDILVTSIRIRKWDPSLASFNLLRTCHYPFMDNVPGFIWNGDIFDPPLPEEVPGGEYEKEKDKETGDGSIDFSGGLFYQEPPQPPSEETVEPVEEEPRSVGSGDGTDTGEPDGEETSGSNVES